MSIVEYSANSESALYPTALIASKEKWLGKNIPLITDISAVGYSANSESVLYHTALIPNQHFGYISDSESVLCDTALIHEYSADLILNFKNAG
jgi:hypothetical protein